MTISLILLQLLIISSNIVISDLLEIQSLFIEGKKITEIQSLFQQYTIAQIKKAIEPQAETPSPKPIGSRKGKSHLCMAHVLKMDILRNLDGTITSEHNVEEIRRRCSSIEGFRNFEIDSDNIHIKFFSREALKIGTIPPWRLGYQITFSLRDCDTLPSVEDVRASEIPQYLDIDAHFITNTFIKDDIKYFQMEIPHYFRSDISVKLGLSEETLEKTSYFNINVEKCPICFETRHLVGVKCLNEVIHQMCPKCTREWSEKSTVFSCPTCRAKHDKKKIQNMLVRDQHREILKFI